MVTTPMRVAVKAAGGINTATIKAISTFMVSSHNKITTMVSITTMGNIHVSKLCLRQSWHRRTLAWKRGEEERHVVTTTQTIILMC